MKNENKFRTVRGYQLQNAQRGSLTSSMEDYLEMICRICINNSYTRINQLARALNVRPSSATKLIQRLSKQGLVHYEKYGIIKPTPKGWSVGNFLLQRHNTIEKFLRNLGIKETLLKDTEMMEHDVSPETLKGIHILNRFFSENPNIKEQYIAFKNKCLK